MKKKYKNTIRCLAFSNYDRTTTEIMMEAVETQQQCAVLPAI